MGRATLSINAYQELKAQIASGELRHGQKITEASISELLGVGRGPARETLLRLEADGYVQRAGPRCARYIKSVEEQSLEEVQHQYELREVVDGLAARRAALKFTGEQILRLRSIVAQIAAAIRKANRRERLAAIHLFYMELRQSCGNPLVSHALTRCGVNTPYFLQDARDARVMELLDRHQPMVKSLSEVVDAIDAHDPERAEAAMRAWTRGSWRAVRDSDDRGVG